MNTPDELPEDIQDALEEICDQGNEALDEGESEEALVFYRQALDILPPPAESWEVFSYIQAAMGDAFFALNEYAKALECFVTATESNDDKNAFILMRMGQCHRRLGDDAAAIALLHQAYEIDGEVTFDEDPEDLAFLQSANVIA